MELLNELLAIFKDFATLDSAAKAAAVVMGLMALWKSSILAPFWEKLGKLKVLVAPILGLLLAIFQLPEFTFDQALPVIWKGIQSGVLAMGFHAILKALEEAPWIGEKYKKWLAFVDQILFKPKSA